MNIDLAALPDDVDTLKRMVRTLATERANLTAAQAEIERLRLIVQKLQRSQFGRRAERLDDDQLQFGFEDLHADIARVEATLPSMTVKTPRSRPDRPSVPLLRRRTACDRRDGQRDARSCARAASSDPHLPAALWLPGVRDYSSGARSGASNRQGPRQSRSSRPCPGRQVLRSPSALPAEPNLRPARGRSRSLDSGELGGRRLLVAGAAAGPPRSTCFWINQAVCRRHADPGARSRPRPHQDRPVVGLCPRRSTLVRARTAGRGLFLQS